MVQTSYIPSRKVIAGGVAGIASWAILIGLGRFGVTVPEDLQTLLPALIGSAISYLVPPSAQDVIRRMDDRLVAMAGRDEASAVSSEVGAAAARVAYAPGGQGAA